MWESICLTIAATAGNNIGKVLQKKGTVILPPLSFKLKAPPFPSVFVCEFVLVIRAYAFNKPWVIGFLMDIFGALLMLRALSLAPVSVIQPVSGCGLAILSVFSHFYLKEMMNAVDWVGITIAGIGTIGVGAGGEEQEASSISISHLPWLACVVAFLFVAEQWPYVGGFNCFLQVLLNGWLRMYRRQRREQELMQSEVVEEIIYGLESGVLFGYCLSSDMLIASVISKMGFLFLEQGFSKLLVPICISISICCSASGFVYQTRGLKHGRAIVVSTCAAVASIVTGVLAGMFALGERLPTSPMARLWLLLGWLFIILGVVLLVSSTRLVRYLPRPWRRAVRSGVDKNFGLRPSGSLRARDTNPSAVIQATTFPPNCSLSLSPHSHHSYTYSLQEFEMKLKMRDSLTVLAFLKISIFLQCYVLYSAANYNSQAPAAPALYVFGDSLLDSGNNNFLLTIARANFKPYGVNFASGATGRFTNGKTVADFIAEYLGLQFSPPYMSFHGSVPLTGLNYASGACGIVPETGKYIGKCLSFNQQIDLFQQTIEFKLPSQFEGLEKKLSTYLSKSIFVVSMGSNDYINNYLQPHIYDTSRRYSPQAFAQLLMDILSQQFQRLYKLGARKVVTFEIGPIGCIPSIARQNKHNGRCVEEINQLANVFNKQLATMLTNLTSTLEGSAFILGHANWLGYDAIIRPSSYGVVILVSSTRLVGYLPRPWRHVVLSGVNKNFDLRPSSSLRVRDTNPSKQPRCII
ncbi:hypothetical protein RJ640_019557 [Escallonia rubra]|uniref:Magnesium transporter n=1 Tax=Escallonia rubra TaxID=112253 RepID=A0AA88RNE0_9ASTE|nr:hypothetical protein RJ640_019557 [Escallonia rubra]